MSDILAVDKVIMHYATYVVVHSVPSTYRDQGILSLCIMHYATYTVYHILS